MKIILASFLFFLIFSCAGTPEPGESTQPPEDAVETVFAGTEKNEEPIIPEVMVTEPPPPEEPLIVEFFDEPKIEFAETDRTPEPFPEETPVITGLPEPDASFVQAARVEELKPIVEAPPVVQSPPEPERISPPASVPAPPPTPPPALTTPSPPQRPAPQIPAPPALLAPAEEKPPAAVRQQVEPSWPEPPAVSHVKEDASVIYSRTVRAVVGQIVEIPFRGAGWVYLGELASRRGIVYESRRLDSEGQSFMFRTSAAGTYSLKFYKQDFIRDLILNDHVLVIVGEAPAAAGTGWFNPPLERERVLAEPRWPATLEEAEMQRSGISVSPGTSANTPPADVSAGEPAAVPVSQGNAVPAQSPAAVGPPAVNTAPEKQADLPPEDLLQKAKETFDEGKVASAIALLDQYREHHPSGSDEAWWLYGQFYEANSPSRDILTALDYYRRLIREYPQSGRYNDARRRIAYLERYYINIQ